VRTLAGYSVFPEAQWALLRQRMGTPTGPRTPVRRSAQEERLGQKQVALQRRLFPRLVLRRPFVAAGGLISLGSDESEYY
jgi:hypothetical protein